MTQRVRFVWKQGGNHVLLAGSFNDWQAAPMWWKNDGIWDIEINLAPGSYQYKFVVDGHWFYDYEEKTVKSGGVTNNLITVGKEGSSVQTTHAAVTSPRGQKKGPAAVVPTRAPVHAPIRAPSLGKVIARHPQEVIPVASRLINFLRNDDTLKWQISSDIPDVQLKFPPENDIIQGDVEVARYLARLEPHLCLYGSDAITTTEIDSWIEKSMKLAATIEETFVEMVGDLNTHLKMRTYFSGHDISLADVFLWISLVKSPFWQSIINSNKKKKYQFLARWWDYIESIEAFSHAKELIPQTNNISVASGTFEDLIGGIPGKVVCRFPPEPSGFLHIGHAKAAFLNDYYARKYNGKLIIRFDDTNPRKEKEEFENAILKDLETMGVRGQQVSHTSNYFDQILEKAEALIKIGKAFCDNLDAQDIKDLRENFKPSPSRDTPVKNNLELWEEMKKGTPIGQTYVLRAKIDYANTNGTMRDPVIYRYIDTPHNRTGTKYKVYPIYNFACPVVDSIEGVTHALRSNEYHDSEAQYYWFIKNVPGLRPVIIKDFSRVNFTYTVLSKRKLQWFVDNGIVDGWDDPRFPTIQGVTRRGLKMESLKKFMYSLGDSKNTVCMDISNVWNMNKTIIDKIIPRFTAVRKENIVEMHLDGPSSPEKVQVFCHRQVPELGHKYITRSNKVFIEQEDAVLLSVNTEVTLIDWGNVLITDIKKKDNKVTSIQAKLHLEGDYKKTEYKLTWLPAFPDKLANLVLIEYDTLINVKTLPKKSEGKDVDWHQFVNQKTKIETLAYGDPNLLSLTIGDQFQLERIGYYVLDSPPGQLPMSLVMTPGFKRAEKT